MSIHPKTIVRLNSMNDLELDEELKYIQDRGIMDETDEKIVQFIENKLNSWWRKEGIL